MPSVPKGDFGKMVDVSDIQAQLSDVYAKSYKEAMNKMPPSSWGKLGESKGGSPPPSASQPSPAPSGGSPSGGGSPPSGGGGSPPPSGEDPDTIVTPWGTSFKAKSNLKDPTEPLFKVDAAKKEGVNVAAPE